MTDYSDSLSLAKDFFIEGSHARMSQRKASDIIGVSQQAICKKCDTLFDIEERETISLKGLSGDNLNILVGYYATANQVSQDVRNNCVNLLIQSSKIGFQALIDEMAGIKEEKLENDFTVLKQYVERLMSEALRPQLDRINEYDRACEEHKGTGYVITSSAFRNNYPIDSITTSEYCKRKGLDKSLWATFSKRYGQFVRVGTKEEPPKRGNKLIIFGDLYYYADCALKSVMDLD